MNTRGLHWTKFLELTKTYLHDGKHTFLVLTEVQVRYLKILYKGLVIHSSLRSKQEKRGGE